MCDFITVLESIGGRGKEADTVADIEVEEEVDEKELEEQVNDLVEIRKKDILKKNLLNILRENLELKAKLKRAEKKIANQTDRSDHSFNTLFTIDNEGDEETEPTELMNANAAIILTHSQQDIAVEEEPKKTGGNRCFNCLGDHMIAECPQPRNPKEINRNKREHQLKMASFNTARYHVDENQKFGHLRPGLPSQKLRQALRLRNDQVPEYIYRMRDLGYPPGWLRRAEIRASGIQLYHEQGEKMLMAGDEDGEVVEDKDTLEYDIERLVEWPGFNSPLPSEFRDETSKYRAAPLKRVKLLKDMVEEMRPKEQKAYVRGKMQDTSVADTTESSQDAIMEDVVVQKEIEGREEVCLTSTPSRQVSTSSSTNSVSKTEPGTPICEVYSPFARLPSQVDWAKDMSEHVAFENLPDYTGKWEQMKSLLKRIKKRGEVNNEEEESQT